MVTCILSSKPVNISAVFPCVLEQIIEPRRVCSNAIIIGGWSEGGRSQPEAGNSVRGRSSFVALGLKPVGPDTQTGRVRIEWNY